MDLGCHRHRTADASIDIARKCREQRHQSAPLAIEKLTGRAPAATMPPPPRAAMPSTA